MAQKESNINSIAAPPPHRLDRGLDVRYRTGRVHRAGNSLAIYIPKNLAFSMGFDKFREVKIYIVSGVLCIQPVKTESFVPNVIGVRK